MKYKSILSLFIFLLGFGVSTTSCEDMLTPDMDRYSEGFSGNDTVYFYLGILRNVQDMVEQNELLSDLRSDLVTSTSYSSDSIADLINYQRGKNGDNALLNRSAYYKVINQCNFYLAKVDTNAIKNNIFYMRREYAQVVAIRAWTYLQLVQTYGKVPFITKPVDNANTGWEKNPESWADADNLVDLLKGDLEKAQVFERTLGYPSYGSYNTGSVNIDHTLFLCISQTVRHFDRLVDLRLLQIQQMLKDVISVQLVCAVLLSRKHRPVGRFVAYMERVSVNGILHTDDSRLVPTGRRTVTPLIRWCLQQLIHELFVILWIKPSGTELNVNISGFQQFRHSLFQS